MSAPVVEVDLSTVEAWAECTYCQAVRPASKYRPNGPLRCEYCGRTRDHRTAYSFQWRDETAWFERLFATAGFEVLVDDLRDMNSGKPCAVDVSCSKIHVSGVEGPLADVTITVNRNLTPWGLARALRVAWDALGRQRRWLSHEWGERDRLGWMFAGGPGDIDPRHRHEWFR